MCRRVWQSLSLTSKKSAETKSNVKSSLIFQRSRVNVALFPPFLTVNLHGRPLFDEKCPTMHQRNHLEINLHQPWTLLAHEKGIFLLNDAKAACELPFVLSLNWRASHKFDLHVWEQQDLYRYRTMSFSRTQHGSQCRPPSRVLQKILMKVGLNLKGLIHPPFMSVQC